MIRFILESIIITLATFLLFMIYQIFKEGGLLPMSPFIQILIGVLGVSISFNRYLIRVVSIQYHMMKEKIK